jgi:hypothetical protein
MGRVHKADWTTTFLVTSVFTAPISSADASGDSIHFALLLAFAFYTCWAAAPSMRVASHVWFASNTPLAPSLSVLLPRLHLWP